MSRFFSPAIFGVVLLLGTAGCSVRAGYRYHDVPHSDYHRWDANERHHYDQWRMETHHDREFKKLNRHDQDEYWNWRHSHP